MTVWQPFYRTALKQLLRCWLVAVWVLFWSSCSPDFGIEGVIDRFGQITPKILITANAYFYNGKQHDSLSVARNVVARIPSIQENCFWFHLLMEKIR